MEAGVGDATVAKGWHQVPETGSPAAYASLGAQEIMRTRDYIAGVDDKIPLGKPAFRAASGISSGTADPSGGNNGDLYVKLIAPT